MSWQYKFTKKMYNKFIPIKKGTRYSMNSWPRFQIKQKISLL